MCSRLEPFGAIRSHLEPYGDNLTNFDPLWIILTLFDPFGAILTHLTHFDIFDPLFNCENNLNFRSGTNVPLYLLVNLNKGLHLEIFVKKNITGYYSFGRNCTDKIQYRSRQDYLVLCTREVGENITKLVKFRQVRISSPQLGNSYPIGDWGSLSQVKKSKGTYPNLKLD